MESCIPTATAVVLLSVSLGRTEIGPDWAVQRNVFCGSLPALHGFLPLFFAAVEPRGAVLRASTMQQMTG